MFISEAEEWKAERERIERRQSARSRSLIRWFAWRIEIDPEPDVYRWWSVEELLAGKS